MKKGILKPEPVFNKKQNIAGDEKLFEEGYNHGLVSNKLIDFRLSFRLGFRKAKLEQQKARMMQEQIMMSKYNR